jgi:hypothetical protein
MLICQRRFKCFGSEDQDYIEYTVLISSFIRGSQNSRNCISTHFSEFDTMSVVIPIGEVFLSRCHYTILFRLHFDSTVLVSCKVMSGT